MIRFKTAAEAVRSVQSGNRVFVHGSAATPGALFRALLDRAGGAAKTAIVMHRRSLDRSGAESVLRARSDTLRAALESGG